MNALSKETSELPKGKRMKLDELKIIAQHFFSFERYIKAITNNDTDIHELLLEIMTDAKQRGIKDNGFFLKDIDGKLIGLAIIKGLREIINEHGPLQKLFIGAAVKRIVNNLLQLKGQ